MSYRMSDNYRVHRYDLNMNKDQDKFEEFLNGLDGKIISVVPNVKPTFQGMGATAKVDFVYVIVQVSD